MGRPADETSGEAHGEFALIARHFTRPPRDRSVRVGVGDDAAVVAPSPGCELVLAVDMMVEGRHFLPGADPETLGHKILAVNLSDLAAMGARPRWALLALALPDEDDAWLAAFSRGLFALAAVHGVDLVGGDTTRGPRNLCLTIAGEVPAGAAILRGGARAGDDLWVSGTLGDAMLGLAALEGRTTLDGAARAACVGRLEHVRDVASEPVGDVEHRRGDAAQRGPQRDARRRPLEASKVGAVVELAALPRSAALDRKLAGSERSLALQCLLAGGDDYELVFSASPTLRERVAAAGRDTGVPVARIGRIVAKDGLVVNDEQGTAMAALPRAFDHFATRRP